VDKEDRQAGYLAKAREADENAAAAKDQRTRDSWLKIANSYRELAKFGGRLRTPGE
jgi:uncharacterized alpha-E superfamily protein